ncbi:thioredoxin domain-containing protein [Bacteroidota bacterium]
MRTRIVIIACLMMSSYLSGQDASIIQVNSEKFHELISGDKGILVDVRTASEFKNGHIPDAGQLNYYAFDFKKKLSLLPKDQAIYLYCNTGYRSEKAAEMLIENGYANVYNLKNGIMEWELIDLPVIAEPDARPDTDNKVDPGQYYAILESDSIVFIDFYAPWCGPCRKMMPMIDSLKTEYHQQISMYKVNADASKKLIKELKLSGVPYLALFQNGKLLWSNNGSVSRSKLTSILDESLLNQSN